MFGSEGIEPIDGVSEGSCISDVLPGEGSQASYKFTFSVQIKFFRLIESIGIRLTAQGSNRGVNRLHEDTLAVDL